MHSLTIHELYENYALEHPSDCAVEDEGRTLSYLELNQKANQLARYLRLKGITHETTVAFYMERSMDMFICILAILKAGAAYLPLSSEQPQERLSFLLKDTQAPIVLINEAIESQFADYSGEIIHLKQVEKELLGLENANLNLKISSDQLTYIIYTSGSTGVPKGVLVEHQSVVNYTIWFGEYCRLKPQQRVEFSANHIFDLAITVSLSPIVLGVTIVICKDEIKKSPRHYLEFLNQNNIQFIKLTPAFLKLILHELKNNPIDLPHLVSVMTGGETLMYKDCLEWLTYFPNQKIYNEYGPHRSDRGCFDFRDNPRDCRSRRKGSYRQCWA